MKVAEALPAIHPHWDERERWSRDKIEEFQLRRLSQQLRYVASHSEWYARQWRDLNFDPADLRALEDLATLPFTDKADYVVSLEQAQPWGSALAAPIESVRRVHFSSGTTSVPTPVCWTGEDLHRWADVYARMAFAQGVRETDVYQCLFSYSWFVGGLGTTAAYERIGAAVIPGGSVDSQRQIRTILRFGVTALAGTPSFLLHLAEVAAELGLDLRQSAVRTIMAGGEPGAQIPATRRRIEDAWGARCYDGYGSLEFQPIAWECEEQAGGHLAEDFVIAEVVDPLTKKAVADGQSGVLVLTHLDKQACPLVRWWTGDVVVRDSSPCGCGRTHARLVGGVHGRTDDMLIIRGVNVFPSAIEEIIRSYPGLTGEYQIVLDGETRDSRTGFLQMIKLRVESEDGAQEATAVRLTAEIREQLKVRAIVEVLAKGALPRSTHKASRIHRSDD